MSFFSQLWNGSADVPAEKHQEQAKAALQDLKKEIGKINGKIWPLEQENHALQTKLKKKFAEVTAAKKSGRITYANQLKQSMLPDMRRKKEIENKLKQLQGTRQNLTVQKDQLETISTNKQVADAMKQANQVGTRQLSEIKIEEIDDIMDDFMENREAVGDVTRSLSNTDHLYDVGLDDDTLGAEFDQMQEEFEMDEEASFWQATEVPETPSHNPVIDNDHNDNSGTPEPVEWKRKRVEEPSAT